MGKVYRNKFWIRSLAWELSKNRSKAGQDETPVSARTGAQHFWNHSGLRFSSSDAVVVAFKTKSRARAE